MDYFEIIADSLLRNAPAMAGWLVGIIIAAVMVGRGGGRAEKLLLAGCCLMFFTKLAGSFNSVLVKWLESENTLRMSAQAFGLLFLPLSLLSLAGLVCLVWAFWVRFRVKKQEAA